MHKIITRKTVTAAVIIAMIIALGACLCMNLLSPGDISVFNRAIMV